MNQHTKAQIISLRLLAGYGASRLALLSAAFSEAEAGALKKLVDELHLRAANLETAEPDPRNRRLTARRESMKALKGRKVRALRTFRDRGGMEYPAGMIWTIEGHWRGKVHVSNGLWYPSDGSDPHPIAERSTVGGQAGYLRHVSLDSFELLPK